MSAEFAFVCGATFGTLMRAGLPVMPEFDADGNYLNSAKLILTDPVEGKVVRLTITEVEPDER